MLLPDSPEHPLSSAPSTNRSQDFWSHSDFSALLPKTWESRLERLRPTWSERGEKLERLLRRSRLALPGALFVVVVVGLITFWNESIIRVVLIEYLAIASNGFLYVFYWILPRQREIFRIPFDEYIAKVRMVRGRRLITPSGLASGARRWRSYAHPSGTAISRLGRSDL